MKTYRYVPTQARGEDAIFEGYVELRLPLFEEKLEYTRQLGVQVSDEGKVESLDGSDKIGILIKMLKIAKEHYVSIALKHKASGEEYKTYEDLSCDNRCSGILSEVASAVINKPEVGNG